jgi:hypothetical protein
LRVDVDNKNLKKIKLSLNIAERMSEDSESPRFILFGEWVYAKHSIHYSKLPAYFIAFDIFDLQNQSFLSGMTKEKSFSRVY